MKHTFKFIALSGIILGASGCASLTGESGYFRDKSSDYVDESVTPDLVIPKNLKPVQPVEFMAIPALPAKAKISRDAETPRANRRVVREDGVAYEVVTRNDHPVLVINRSVHMVWPFMGLFWEDKGIPVTETNISQGVVVTDWVQLGQTSRPGFMRRLIGKVIDLENADTSQEKFRLSLRPGQRSGSSEIMLEHVRRSDNDDLTVPVNWTGERHDSPMLENMLLNEILVSMVQNRERQVVASNSGRKVRPDLISMQQDGNGNPTLHIGLGFAPGWQAVENALTEMGVTIVDRNRSLGLIYIDVDVQGEQLTVQPEEKRGWFGGWFRGDEKDKAAAAKSDSEYSVRVQSSGGGINVTLEEDLNTLPPVNISRQFLEQLRENI